MKHIGEILHRIEMKLELQLFSWMSKRLHLEEPWWIQYDREIGADHG
jgi:hypothetical protein